MAVTEVLVTNGGGIIIIKAASIINNGAYTISSNGLDNTVVASGDGSGGGGAGGTILLEVGSFTNPLTISAKGGKGGDHSNPNCHGTGGGGGGGVIWFSGSCTPAGVTTNISGGINGKQIAASPDCGPSGSDWGATPGANGIVRCGLAGGASVFLNTNTCTLPVELKDFKGFFRNGKVILKWISFSEEKTDAFEIEKSTDGYNYSKIGILKSIGDNSGENSYSFVDYETENNHLIYYRLKIIDIDQSVSYSSAIVVSEEKISESLFHVYPNPASQVLNIVSRYAEKGALTIELRDLVGKTVFSKTLASPYHSEIALEVGSVTKGSYLLILYTEEDQEVKRIILE